MRGFLGGVSTGAIVAIAGAAMVSLSVPLEPWVTSPQNVTETAVSEGPNETQAKQDTSAFVPVDGVGEVPDPEGAQDAEIVNLAPNPLVDTVDVPETTSQIEAETAARPDVDLRTDGLAPLSEADVIAIPQEQADALRELDVSQQSSSKPSTAPQIDILPDTAPDVATQTAIAAAVPTSPTGENTLDITAKNDSLGETAVPQITQAQDDGITTDSTPARANAPGVAQLPEVANTSEQEPVQNYVQDVKVPISTENATSKNVPRSAALPQAGVNDVGTRTSIGQRVVPLIERKDQDEKARQEAEAAAANNTPFARNALAANPLVGQPYMSIVLIEDASSVGMDALGDFPYPLTVAIDPATPNAAKRMKERRADGVEVMILADLPHEGTPQDAETALPVWFDRLPDVIGVLEGVKTGVQGNRALAEQVATIVGGDGYGLVLQNNGLNTVQKLAARDGVPSGVVFRDFDGAGQDARAMRRFLDQAAFRARQEKAVIMVGRLTAETISTLLVWGLQDRANQVALVPVSASLKLLQTP